MSNTQKALIALDFINEIVHPEGKLAGKGYAEMVSKAGVFAKLNRTLEEARQAMVPVIWVRVGFDPLYRDWPEGSPLFGAAKKFKALELGSWGTEIHSELDVEETDLQFVKPRVSAFSNSTLDTTLRSMGVDEIYLAGVATDLAIASTAHQGHDLDYSITVVADLCAAANEPDHKDALRLLAKVAAISDCSELEF